MSYEDYIAVFGNVIEHCSLCAAATWRDRPFPDVDSLHKSFCQFADQLPISGKEGILRLYPDLAGRLAASGNLSAESTKEQSSAGLQNLTEHEKEKMNNLNQQYKQKFGFPFVICARENKKEAIFSGLERRLNNSKETEAITGVEEVKKICRLRILDIVDSASKL